MTEAPPRTRAPISLQLVGLLVASLLAAQLISFAVIVLTPPPRPSLYPLAEVAAALEGGALTSRFGRPLERTVAQTLPSDVADHRGPRAHALAAVLHLDPGDVRLVQHPASLAGQLSRRLRGGRGPGPGADPADFQPGFRGDGGPPPGGMRFGGRPPWWGRSAADMPIFGDFTAARRRPDGDWVVVRPVPEPFPTMWQLRSLMWLIGGFALVAPAGYLFARRITAPLKRFSEAAERLGRDPHAPQITLSGPAEIGAAAHAFNNMQARLRRYIDDRTAMVGAISHDLRTPLARIRFRMEAAAPDLRESVDADLTQMEQMIGGVLAFIRDESAPRSRQRLDLLSLVECVADDAALVGGDVEITAAVPVTVDGDPVALQRLFANLVDNAVKYGGRARIDVRREGHMAVVTIADRGPGLSPDELSQVFQPFYRTDTSRNLDSGGVGLGLPIARSTARAHGGDVHLTSGAEGSCASVLLPVAV